MPEYRKDIILDEWVIIASALLELMYCASSIETDNPAALIFTMDTATDAPSSSNKMENVVDVGIPKVLNMSSRITSVIITARKMIIISCR